MAKRARERAGSPEPCMAAEEEEQPTARKSLRKAKTRNDVEEKGLASRVMELSIKIARGAEDVDASLLARVHEFLKQETMAGKCSLVRGGSMSLLHFQMVVRIEARSVVSVGKLVERYLGWDKALPAGGDVECCALTNKGPLRTFLGMLGSCMTDMHEPHFQTIDHNLSAKELARGLDIFVMYGAEDKKGRMSLTQQNLLVHAAAFLRSKVRHRRGSNLESTLLEMVKSGKFYPSMSWVAPPQGRGMDTGRANVLWRTRINPSGATLKDIYEIFVQPCCEEAYDTNGGDARDMFTPSTGELCSAEKDQVMEGSLEDGGSLDNDMESASSEYIPL